VGRTVKVLAQTPAPTSDWFWRRQSPYGRGPPAADRRCPECLGWLFRLAISSIKIPRKIEYFVQFVGASPWQWRGAAHAVGARISWLLSTRRPGDGHAPRCHRFRHPAPFGKAFADEVQHLLHRESGLLRWPRVLGSSPPGSGNTRCRCEPQERGGLPPCSA